MGVVIDRLDMKSTYWNFKGGELCVHRWFYFNKLKKEKIRAGAEWEFWRDYLGDENWQKFVDYDPGMIRKMKEDDESTASFRNARDKRIEMPPVEKFVQEEPAFEELVSETEEAPKKYKTLLPTRLMRTSIFHVMNPSMKSRREYLEGQSIIECSWGSLNFSGPMLSIADEDVLDVLSRLRRDKSLKVDIDADAWFRVSFHRALREMGREYSGEKANRLWESLMRLRNSSFELHRRLRNGEVEQWAVTGIIEKLAREDLEVEGDKRGSILLKFDKHFAAESFLTPIDSEFRRSLKGDLAKALYRFLQSHETEADGSFGRPFRFETLARQCNLQVREMYRVRAQIKKALDELKDKGYLTYRIMKNGQVWIRKKMY